MPKTIVSITVDGNTWDELQRRFPQQMSQKINDYLHRLNSYAKNDLAGMNEAELTTKINNMDQDLAKITAEKSELITELERVRQTMAEREAKEIEKEKKEAMDKVTCDICGIPKPNERVHDLPGGKVCNACYIVTPAQDLRKYIQSSSKKGKKPTEDTKK